MLDKREMQQLKAAQFAGVGGGGGGGGGGILASQQSLLYRTPLQQLNLNGGSANLMPPPSSQTGFAHLDR